MIVYKKFPFNSRIVDDVGKALKNSHAVKIDDQWYFPIRVKYNKYQDTIRFKLDQVHHHEI